MSSGGGYDQRLADLAGRYIAVVREYRETALRLFPSIDRRALESCTISPADALFLGYFLEFYPRSVVALDTGDQVGSLAFYLASHHKVSKVVSIYSGPSVMEGFAGGSVPGVESEAAGSWSSGSVSTLDVARRVTAEHPEEQAKVVFLEGRLIDVSLREREGRARSAVGDEALATVLSEGNYGLVALVDGLRDREGVRESLKAVFELDPRSIAFVGHRQRGRAPFAQAGIADFMEGTPEEHRFYPVGELGPALASIDLGALYPEVIAAEAESTLAKVGRTFSRKLDPLRLLTREEELTNAVSTLNRRLSQTENHRARLEAQTSRLQARNAELLARYSRLRYRLADTLADIALRVPAIKKLAHAYASRSSNESHDSPTQM